VPSFATDRARDTSGELNSLVTNTNAWLASQNDGRAVRFDTYQGVLDVGYLSLDVDEATWSSWFAQQLVPAAEALTAAGWPVASDRNGDLLFVVWEAPAGDYFKTNAGAGTCRPTLDALNSGIRLVGVAAARGDRSTCSLGTDPYPVSGTPTDQRAWFGLGSNALVDHVVQAMRFLPGCGGPVSPRDGEPYTVPGTNIVEIRGGFIRDLLAPHDPVSWRMREAASDAVPALDVNRDTYFRIVNGPLANVACNSDIAKNPLWADT